MVFAPADLWGNKYFEQEIQYISLKWSNPFLMIHQKPSINLHEKLAFFDNTPRSSIFY